MEDRTLGWLDLGAIAAALLVLAGLFLPFRIVDYPYGLGFTRSFLLMDGGIIGLVTSVATIWLAIKHYRIGAIVTLALAGLLVFSRMADIGASDSSTVGVGAYVMALGIVGGITLLALGLARSHRHAAASRHWTPPMSPWTPPPPPEAPWDRYPSAKRLGQAPDGQPDVDPDDPFHVDQ